MSVVVTEPVTQGLILLKTTIGDIKIELWGREAPKAVRNFVQLALEGFYDGSIFHRIVPGFIAQTGGIGTTGDGGECIYDEGVFDDEFNQRLKFSRRGLVAMANQGRNTNMSQSVELLDNLSHLSTISMGQAVDPPDR
jgi:peptidyl-prolyl cis-trans isomerase SDCCAG10